jgi:CheY-like chemotaxis protein
VLSSIHRLHDVDRLIEQAHPFGSQKDDADLALLAGFQVHLPKPVDPYDLTSVIARLAGRSA